MVLTDGDGQKVEIDVFFEKKATTTRGRKRKVITQAGLQFIESLGKIMCTDEEIADILGCSRDLFYTEDNKENFRQAIEKGRANGKESLRREQYKLAMRGDRGMLIWLGKQYLGQSEKFTASVESDNAIVMKNYLDKIKGGTDE